MRITTKGRYALRAVLALALVQSGNEDKPVSIKTISEQEDISAEFLEQIFFRLRKAGVIRSVRGPGGGFFFRPFPRSNHAIGHHRGIGRGNRHRPLRLWQEESLRPKGRMRGIRYLARDGRPHARFRGRTHRSGHAAIGCPGWESLGRILLLLYEVLELPASGRIDEPHPFAQPE